MGRLIDVDEIMRIAKSEFSEDDIFKIQWLVCHTPTAYDVEKVVHRLHIRALDQGADANLNQNRYTTIAHELKIREDECRKIMDIVRNGGKE